MMKLYFDIFTISLFFIDILIILTTKYNENKFCFIMALIGMIFLLPSTIKFIYRLFIG